jgi:thiamine biosynthesis lipoprotein ApbE
MVDVMTVRCQRPAMATRFVFLLVGEDRDHLMAVGEAALDEVTRIERLISRYDPASEVSRINREAPSRPIRIDQELFAILTECRSWFDRTNGYFDICATGSLGSPLSGDPVDLDSKRMSVRLLEPTARLDFGATARGMRSTQRVGSSTSLASSRRCSTEGPVRSWFEVDRKTDRSGESDSTIRSAKGRTNASIRWN